MATGVYDGMVSTSYMTAMPHHMVVTTDASGGYLAVHDPIQQALEYVKEETKRTEFMLHICRCTYCRSNYPANIDLGYECPACGAYDFDIERTVTNDTSIERVERR